MADSLSRFRWFIDELKRRKVPQAGAGYAIIGWLLLQVGEVTFEPLHLPGWALTVLVVLVLAGFPLVLLLSWFFDLGLAGLKRDRGLSAPPPTDSPATDVVETALGPSVAVLAFDDMSPMKDQDYLCDGIAEEILNRLAQIRKLHVASRTSSFRFKKQALDASSIGRQLKVATVLEGSVRKSDNKLRVTTQLINVADGFHLWSNSYDREVADIFDIQDEIAAHVAAALEVTLTRGQSNDTTADVTAYDYYLRGLHYFHRWGLRNVRYAIDMFARATATDPGYSRAWAALADSHAMVCMYWTASAEHLEGAEYASRHALSLAPELAEAHVSRGLAHTVHGRHNEAIAEFDTALKLNSELFSAHYFFARVCFQRGHLARAVELFEQCEHIRPEDFQAPILLRQIYRTLGREQDAMDAARRGVRLAEQHLQLYPDDTRALNLGLGGLADLGERAKLLEFAGRSLAIDGENPDTLYNVACGYARAGEPERALECLERAALRGTSIAEWAEHDSDLESLRGEPRFIALIDRMRSASTEEHPGSP